MCAAVRFSVSTGVFSSQTNPRRVRPQKSGDQGHSTLTTFPLSPPGKPFVSPKDIGPRTLRTD